MIPTAAVASILLSLATTTAGLLALLPQQTSARSVAVPPRQVPESRRPQYEVIMLAQVLDEAGVHFGSTTYRALDGTKITVLHNRFDTPELAFLYLEKKLAKAKRAAAYGRKKSRDGKVVGERVQFASDSGSSGKKTHSVVWTDGADYYDAKSVSLRHLLQVERALTR